MRIVTGKPSPAVESRRGAVVMVPILCGLIQVLDGYDLNTIGLAVPYLMKEWSLPPSAFTPAFVLSSVGIMIGAIVAGPIGDRIGRRPVLLFSVLVFGAFSLLSAWAPSRGWLEAMRFLTGVGIGGAMPTTVALTADYVSERWRATVIMFMFCGAAAGGFVAGQVAALVVPHGGWRAIFMIGGALPLAILPFLLALPESSALRLVRLAGHVERNPVKALFAKGRAATTSLLWLIFLTNLLSMYLINYWLPTVLALQGLTPSQAAAATSCNSMGGTLSPIVLALLLYRFRAEWVLATNATLGIVAVVAIVFARPEGIWLSASVFCVGAGFVGSQLGLNGFAAAVYPTELRATGVGWALGIGRLGGIFGPALGGLLLGVGFSPSFVLLSVCASGVLTVASIVMLGRARGPSNKACRRTDQLGDIEGANGQSAGSLSR